MTLEQALQLDAEQFWKHPDIVLAIQTALNPGPWKHALDVRWLWRGQPKELHKVTKCLRCKTDEPTGVCPVPPPLEMEPEVVARKLRDEAWESKPFEFCEAITVVWQQHHDTRALDDSVVWYAFEASPEEQSLCCLLALGQLKEGG